jgi:type 1 glutamine amidotransferase
MHAKSTYAVLTSAIALIAAACGDGLTADKLNDKLTGGSAGTAAGTAGAGAVGGAMGGTPSTGGMAGTGVTTGGGAGVSAGTAGAGAAGGAAGTTGASATGGTGGIVEPGPYDARTGTFKMLVYSITKAFEHPSIPAGQQMLRDIAQDYGFEITVATDNSQITLEGLSQYEIVFFMNCTGDIFNSAEEAAFEEWMTTRNGAFAGAHSATDTERDWQFYKEVVGQYYDLHDNVSPGTIQWESAALGFVAVQGLPSPWQREEEWYRFNSYQDWSSKEGFTILSKVTTNGGGTRPVSYTRQYDNFRSFYSSIGHEARAFQDADVQKHFAAGIMWAVRREALVVP